jgi:hypothetical protein
MVGTSSQHTQQNTCVRTAEKELDAGQDCLLLLWEQTALLFNPLKPSDYYIYHPL